MFEVSTLFAVCLLRNTHDGRNGVVVLLSVLEQSQDIVTDNDTLLARQNVLDTHIDCCLVGLTK